MEARLDGTVKRSDGRYDVHFERHFDAPVERLWAAVTEPELLEGWLGGPVDELELTEGGNVVIQIHPKGPATVYGKVIRVEPLEVLELTLGRAGLEAHSRLLRYHDAMGGPSRRRRLEAAPDALPPRGHVMARARHARGVASPPRRLTGDPRGRTDPALRGERLLPHAGRLREPRGAGGVAAIAQSPDDRAESSVTFGVVVRRCRGRSSRDRPG